MELTVFLVGGEQLLFGGPRRREGLVGVLVDFVIIGLLSKTKDERRNESFDPSIRSQRKERPSAVPPEFFSLFVFLFKWFYLIAVVFTGFLVSLGCATNKMEFSIGRHGYWDPFLFLGFSFRFSFDFGLLCVCVCVCVWVCESIFSSNESSLRWLDDSVVRFGQFSLFKPKKKTFFCCCYWNRAGQSRTERNEISRKFQSSTDRVKRKYCIHFKGRWNERWVKPSKTQ